MGETLSLDPKTGDYVMDSQGKPTFEKGLLVPAYLRLKASRSKWMYSPDVDYGSDYHLITKRVTRGDNILVDAITEKALKPLLDDGRASKVEIEPKEYTRHTAELNIKLSDAQGQVEELEFNPIGVR